MIGPIEGIERFSVMTEQDQRVSQVIGQGQAVKAEEVDDDA